MQLASMKVEGWEVIDGEWMHRLRPETFDIPSLEERQGLKVGQYVKLTFEMRPDSDKLKVGTGRPILDQIVEAQDRSGKATERMWVSIDRVAADGFVGILNSKPNNSSVLKLGDIILFEARHVIQIHD